MIVSRLQSTSSGDYAELDDLVKMIREQAFRFKERKAKGTPVTLSINRDNDGLIKITLECDKVRQTFEANPAALLIDAETKANIEHSLSLMDQ